MIDINIILHDCENAENAVKNAYNHIDEYINKKVPITEARRMVDILRHKRDDSMYNIATVMIADSGEYADAINKKYGNPMSLYERLNYIIAECSCLISCIDRYVAEHYCYKIEKAFNPNCMSVDLKYCTDFNELKRRIRDER